MSDTKCPFKVGDIVVYMPGKHVYDFDAISPKEPKLQKGKNYKIFKIENDTYVFVESCKHPDGGIYWTEFTFNGAMKECPFKVGEIVVYSPTLHGRGQVIMTEYHVLKHGSRCKIAEIIDGFYVVVEGFENAAGGSGLYWEEFSAISQH